MKEKFRLKLTDWTKIPIETAQLLLDESSEYVSYTVAFAEKITQRGYAFSVIIIAAIGGLLGKLLTIKIETSFDCALFWLLSVSVIVMFLIGILNTKLIFPFALIQKGRSLEKIGNQNYLAPSHLKDKNISHLSFLLAEIENNQNKIEYNQNENLRRLKQLKRLIFLVIISFPIFLVSYIAIFTIYQQ